MQTKIIAIVALALAVIAFVRPDHAHSQGKNFNSVMPFFTSGGSLGFFDQSEGKVYIYDSNLSSCIFQGKLENLGEPILPSSAVTAAPEAENP